MTNKWMWIAPSLAAVLFAGCGKKKEEKPAEKMVEKGSGAEPAKATGPIGINDPTNDAEVVKVAKQLLADCGAKMDESAGNSDKPAQKKSMYSCDKWAADFGDKQFEKKDATFANFLKDPDVKVRSVGESGLSKSWDWHSDKALAQKVIDALKAEKAPSPIDLSLALRVADISESAGLDDQIKAIAIDPKTSNDVKLALLAWWHGKTAYEAVKANAASTDPAIQNAVVQGYALHFDDHADEACAYWEQHLDNQYAIGHLTGGWNGNTIGDSESEDYITGGGGGPDSGNDKRCSEAQLNKALDQIEKNKATPDKGSGFDDYAIAELMKDKLTPAAVKTRVTKMLTTQVEKKGSSYDRGHALRALVESGDPQWMTYAKKFAKDEELKDTVADIEKDAAEKAKKEKEEKAKK